MRSTLGACLSVAARYADAEPLLLEAEAGQRGAADADRRRATMRRLVSLYERWGKPPEATEWRQRLQ